MLWRVLRDIFTTGTRHTDIYLKNSSVLPFWQDNYVGDDDDVVVLSRHVMPFAGTSDEFDRFAALQRVQFLADPTGRRHEGDETRLVALEPAGADGLMRLPPVRLSVERGQTGGIFTLPICGHTPMPPFRGSSAFQERLFVVAMFFYSLSSLRVPCGRPNTFSRFVGPRLVAQPLIAVVRFCWALVKAS